MKRGLMILGVAAAMMLGTATQSEAHRGRFGFSYSPGWGASFSYGRGWNRPYYNYGYRPYSYGYYRPYYGYGYRPYGYYYYRW